MVSDKPPVICVTPTYGRFHLLCEMVWCWTKQDYPNKRLLIVNDQPNVTIECAIPDVTVINVSKRFEGLGAKRNFITKQIPDDVEFVVTMDDDDLFLPQHISCLVEAMPDTALRRTKSRLTYVADDNRFTTVNTHWPCYGASCFHAADFRTFWMQDSYMWGEDTDMLNRHHVHSVPAECGTFIYRRGMDVVHASGHSEMVYHDPSHQSLVKQRIENGTYQYPLPTTLELIANLEPESRELFSLVTKMEAARR